MAGHTDSFFSIQRVKLVEARPLTVTRPGQGPHSRRPSKSRHGKKEDAPLYDAVAATRRAAQQREALAAQRQAQLYRVVWKFQVERLSLILGAGLITVVLFGMALPYWVANHQLAQSFQKTNSSSSSVVSLEDARFSFYRKVLHRRELQTSDGTQSSIPAEFAARNILRYLVSHPFDYFIFLWILMAVPMGFGFCCWLCAQRNYQKLVSVSP